MNWPAIVEPRRALDLEQASKRLATHLSPTFTWWENYAMGGGTNVLVDPTWGTFLYCGVMLAKVTGEVAMGDETARLTGMHPDHRLLMGVIPPTAPPAFLVEFPLVMRRVAELLGAPYDERKLDVSRRGIRHTVPDVPSETEVGALPSVSGGSSSATAHYGADPRKVLDPRETRADQRRKAQVPESYTLKWSEQNHRV